MAYNAAGVAVSGYNIATGQAGIGDYLNFLPAIGGILGKLRQACFTEGTQVVVGYDEQGVAITRNIEGIREGDWVLAKDENNPDGEPVLKQVTKVWIKTVTQLRVLTLTNETGDEQVIQTTDEHPFFVEGRGWIGAGELAAWDRVLTATGVSTVAATSVVQHPQGITVYNLEVEGSHTFFVDDVAGGVDAAWVHNANYKIKHAAVRPYGQFNRPPNVGDAFAGHEILQNAWLKHNGYKSLVGRNPAIALDRASHNIVTASQRLAGLLDPETLNSMSAIQVATKNMQILRSLQSTLQLSPAKLQSLERKVFQFIARLP